MYLNTFQIQWGCRRATRMPHTLRHPSYEERFKLTNPSHSNVSYHHRHILNRNNETVLTTTSSIIPSHCRKLKHAIYKIQN